MSAAFAHHMSPDLAFEALRSYRREFTPPPGARQPYSAMSVLAFASDGRRGGPGLRGGVDADHAEPPPRIREPLRPEQVLELSRSAEFRAGRRTTAGW